jgi:hypothetical protein
VVEGLATALRDEAIRIGSAQARLAMVRSGSRWDSPAGRAFAARVTELPPLLGAVAERYVGAAAVLRVFAAEFREAQDACTRAILLRERGIIRRDRFGEAMAQAELSDAPAEQARVPELRALMVQGAAEVLEQEQLYRRAQERFREADQRCARSLGALLDDALTDSWQYDTVKGTASVARSTAETAGLLALVPGFKPAAGVAASGAAGLGLAADTVLWAAYQEGALEPLVTEAALGMVGVGAGVLRNGARLGAPPSAAHSGPSELLTPRARIAGGMRAQIKQANPWPPREVSSPGGSGGAGAVATGRSHVAPRSLGDRARRAVDLRLAAVRGDWNLATRNGADARAMLLTAYGLHAGRTVYDKAPQVTDAFERAQRLRERAVGRPDGQRAPDAGPPSASSSW